MLKYKIVADSSADLLELEDVDFAAAALKIITDNKEYVDDASLDVKEMVHDLASYSGKSSSSCPSTGDWLEAFGDADRVFCVTITSNLSGSWNSARMAKDSYEEEHLGRRVFVIDSLSAGPELMLIIEKLRYMILEGREYEEICDSITDYCEHTGLLFMLESMQNLANNGRCSHLVAKAAGLLGIRVVGRASDVGTLEPLDKCRGEKKALAAIVSRMKALGCTGGKVRIAHCLNAAAAVKLKGLIEEAFEKVEINIYRCGGLCSFYAEKGGLLVGFEKGM